jgi:hypothetical protein
VYIFNNIIPINVKPINLNTLHIYTYIELLE